MTVHIEPVADLIQHLNHDCPCGPHYEWVDPDTGATYPDGPLIVHHSLDGRERQEP